jgi:hypothetical protein
VKLCLKSAIGFLLLLLLFLVTFINKYIYKIALIEFMIFCDRQVNEIIKQGLVRVKRYPRPSDLEVSGHSLRVGAAQDLLIKGQDMAAIMRAGEWSEPSTVARYLRFAQHNIWQ